MTWQIPTLFAIARRVARLNGRHSDEAYPVITTRERKFIGCYVRDVGWIR